MRAAGCAARPLITITEHATTSTTTTAAAATVLYYFLRHTRIPDGEANGEKEESAGERER